MKKMQLPPPLLESLMKDDDGGWRKCDSGTPATPAGLCGHV